MEITSMSMNTDRPAFDALLLGLKNLDDNELVEVQTFVQELLDKIPPEQLHNTARTIDMSHFETLRTDKSPEHKVEVASLLKAISELDTERLVLLDIMIIFLTHRADLKTALPDILRKTRYEIKRPLGLTEIVFPSFVLPKKSGSQSANDADRER
jgi:hypothetical protein